MAAQGIAVALVEAVDSLGELAERGRPTESGRELVTVWPYVILYRVIENRVVILRVRHGRQRRE